MYDTTVCCCELIFYVVLRSPQNFLQRLCLSRPLPAAGSPSPSMVAPRDEIASRDYLRECSELHTVVSPVRARQPVNHSAASIGLAVRGALEQTVRPLLPSHAPFRGMNACHAEGHWSDYVPVCRFAPIKGTCEAGREAETSCCSTVLLEFLARQQEMEHIRQPS